MSGEIQTVTEVIGDIADTLHQLPAPIKRNLISGVAALIAGIIEVPASFLEMKASEFKIRQQGHEQIMLAAARQAADLAGHEPEIANRALAYFANDLIKGQDNREAVAREAVQAAKLLPPATSDSDLPLIDDDWLGQFRKLASSKSSTEIQAILGRILAGEAQKPGSFSPITLDVLAKLDRSIAQGFEQVVSYAIISPDLPDLIVSRIIHPEKDEIVDLVNSIGLRHLQSHGLVDASFGHQFNPEYFAGLPPSTLGGQRVIFSANAERKILLSNGEVWPLSRAGTQIAPLLPRRLDLIYARRLRDGMKPLGVDLAFPDIDIDDDAQHARLT